MFLRYLELFRDIQKKISRIIKKKIQEFPETYLGDFSWYLYPGLLRDKNDIKTL